MTEQKPAEGISLYAELLANIRQVSVGVSLPSFPDASTFAQVLDGGRQLQVGHRGTVERLLLPAPVVVDASALAIPTSSTFELRWRLPASEAHASALRVSPEDQAVPWNAKDIARGSPIGCRGCGSAVIQAGRIGTWKDLPSANWAEMMEFWHCHKPHDDAEHDDEALASRGYGANSAITAQPAVGFVDITSLMFSESDCGNVVFSASLSSGRAASSSLAMGQEFSGKYLHVFCGTCEAEVGLYSTLAVAVTLFKWQVTCETLTASKAPSGQECLASTLLSTISRSACAKSVVAPQVSDRSEDGRVLHLWVLNPSVLYTSSSLAGRRAGMKMLFREISAEEGNALVESMSSDVQDIGMPAKAIAEVRHALMSTNRLLPTGERTFKDWSAGLLERWRADTLDSRPDLRNA
ncbi:hypothetical protein RJ55_02497 [Drechmeria coniospora]|nr:hypothetical protein RJ55_02497 [Drechmeria coniospora]